MAAEIDFEPYLRSLSAAYGQWWQLYTLTDAETKAQQKNEPQPWKTPFDFGLMVQTVQRDRSMDAGGGGLEAQTPKEKIERFPVLEGIRKCVKEHQQVLLVGRPGSGKSTTLARLMLEEARACLPFLADHPAIDLFSNPLLGGARGGLVNGATDRPTPPYGHPSEEGIVRDTDFISDSHGLGCIPVLVELRFLSDSTLIDRIQAFFQRHGLQLDRTQIEDLLFHQRLLLLMDGLNELPSEAARLDVAKFRQDYPKVSMIFTTRDLSLGGDFGLEKKLEMQPLTEAQMQAFVRSYVPEQAEAMLRQLKDRLREFGQTPLLLWMLCGLFRQAGQIPNNLGEVFRAFTRGYEKHLKADVPVESDRRWWPELLQELAFWMMRGVPFREEAPAVDVEFRVAISKVEARQIFAAFLQNKEAQAEGVAQKYLDDLLRHHLIQPSGEQIEFRHQLIQEYYAAEALLEQLPKLDDTSLKQQYLNYLKWTEPVGLMLALLQTEIQAERVAKLALEVDAGLGSRLAGKCQPKFQEKTVALVEALELPDWLKIQYLEAMRSEATNAELLKRLEDSDPHVRGSWWRKWGLETRIKRLEDSDSDMRWSTIDALGKINSEAAIPELLKQLEDSDSDMRWRAIDALGKIGSEATIPELLKRLEDSDPDMRAAVANALGKIGSETAISELLKQLEDSDSHVRESVANALSEIGSEVVIAGLLKWLEASDSGVRWSASHALDKIAKKNTDMIAPYLPHLLTLIPTNLGRPIYRVILSIQENCRFYNYKLTQTTHSMKLFFSYAHKDEPLRDELANHLSLLKRQNIITDWHDRNITAGTDWAQTIDHNLNIANIILLLISSDFIASDYCFDKEMTRALELHTQGIARVIPIILRPCDWHSAPFGNLQALPIEYAGGAKPVTQWKDPDEAFLNIAQGIRTAVAELQQPKNAQPNPNPAQPPGSIPTQITYDLRGANIGNWAENQYGTQHTTQIHPNPSQPPETPQ
jgi:HEAT repeat protein